MDPIGIIAVIGLIVLFLAVVAVGIWLAGGFRGVQRERVAFFSVEPNFICPSDSCVVDIGYDVDSTRDNTQVKLQVTSPSGTVTELSTSRNFRRTTSGVDAGLWTEGPGEYFFNLQVVGDQIGNFSETKSTKLLDQQGGTIRHDASVRMSDAADLNVAIDAFRIAELRQGKITEYSICEKSAEMIAIRYVNGGVGGHDPALSITARDANGTTLVDLLNMRPGDEIALNPTIIIAGGIEITGLMVGGIVGTPPNSQPNPFAETDTVRWTIEIDVRCF